MRSEGFYVNENTLTPSGIEPATFRHVAQHFNHCATAVPSIYIYIYIYIYVCVCVFVCVRKNKLNDLYSSPNIVRAIKSRRMRWAGHVARMGEERGCIGS